MGSTVGSSSAPALGPSGRPTGSPTVELSPSASLPSNAGRPDKLVSCIGYVHVDVTVAVRILLLDRCPRVPLVSRGRGVSSVDRNYQEGHPRPRIRLHLGRRRAGVLLPPRRAGAVREFRPAHGRREGHLPHPAQPEGAARPSRAACVGEVSTADAGGGC